MPLVSRTGALCLRDELEEQAPVLMAESSGGKRKCHAPAHFADHHVAADSKRCKGGAGERTDDDSSAASSGDPWLRKFKVLMAYRVREGHCDVPHRHEEQGAKLGMWLRNQRAVWRKGTMDDRRRRWLEEAGVILA